MDSTKALVVQQQVTPQVWQMIQAMAPTMHDARLFGTASANQAAAVMIKGFELGLGLAASFEFIQVVMGKPTLSPRGALALIYRSEELEDLTIEDGTDYCQVTMKRRGRKPYTVKWTMADAIKAGVVKPGSGWENYPANMLRWRAIGFCEDVVFPDIVGGMKRSDEFGANISPDGDVIQGEFKVMPAQPTPTAPPMLDTLIAQFGVDAILAANEGKVPGTESELVKVAEKLAQP
jgi:hypothetical protein